MPERIPLLILSDAPTAGTGLGRIARDIATRTAEKLGDIFNVATLGYGGCGSSKLPFQQYVIEGMQDWIVSSLPTVWDDFAGDQRGIILTIWDATRLVWFAEPKNSQLLDKDQQFRDWLIKPPFERWGYFPIDAWGPFRKLTFPVTQSLLRYDRVLAYSKWAEDIIMESFKGTRALVDVHSLPHGIDEDMFFSVDHEAARLMFFARSGAQTLFGKQQPLQKNELLVGVVATNQLRKDWSLACEVVAELKNKWRGPVRMWMHVDSIDRHWSIPGLIADYGLIDEAMISLRHNPDDYMRDAYGACDVTLGIGLGEGFGYPIFESIFSGTPCVHGNYGGAPEHMTEECLVEPIAYFSEGITGSKRPVFNPNDWVEKILGVAGKRSVMPAELGWSKLWTRWERWLRQGALEFDR